MFTLRIFFAGLIAYAFPANNNTGPVYVVLPDLDAGMVYSDGKLAPDHVPFVLYRQADTPSGGGEQFVTLLQELKLDQHPDSSKWIRDYGAFILDHESIQLQINSSELTIPADHGCGKLPNPGNKSKFCWVPSMGDISRNSQRNTIASYVHTDSNPPGIDARMALDKGKLTSYHFPESPGMLIYEELGLRLTSGAHPPQPFRRAVADIVAYTVKVSDCTAKLNIVDFQTGDVRSLTVKPKSCGGGETIDLLIGHLPPKPEHHHRLALPNGQSAQGRSMAYIKQLLGTRTAEEKSAHFELLYGLCKQPPSDPKDRPVPVWRDDLDHTPALNINPSRLDELVQFLHDAYHESSYVFQRPACPGSQFVYE